MSLGQLVHGRDTWPSPGLVQMLASFALLALGMFGSNKHLWIDYRGGVTRSGLALRDREVAALHNIAD